MGFTYFLLHFPDIHIINTVKWSIKKPRNCVFWIPYVVSPIALSKFWRLKNKILQSFVFYLFQFCKSEKYKLNVKAEVFLLWSYYFKVFLGRNISHPRTFLYTFHIQWCQCKKYFHCLFLLNFNYLGHVINEVMPMDTKYIKKGILVNETQH
jgi:hypothetical protein